MTKRVAAAQRNHAANAQAHRVQKAQGLHELKDALGNLDITNHWEEKIEATGFEPMTLWQRDQGIHSIFVGLAFIISPFIIKSWRRKQAF